MAATSCHHAGMTKMPYPPYSPAERIADGVVHVAGLVAALAGIAAVYAAFALDMDGETLLATTDCSLSLRATLGPSALSPLFPPRPLRERGDGDRVGRGPVHVEREGGID